MNDLHPMPLGEIVDRTATTWRQHWWPLAQMMMGFQLFQYVGAKVLQRILTNPQANDAEFATWVDRIKASQLPPDAVAAAAGSFFLFLLLSTLVGHIYSVAASAYIYPRIVGTGQPTIAASFRHTKERLTATFGSFGIGIVWSSGVTILALVPGALIAAAGVSVATRSAQPTMAVALAVLSFVPMLATLIGLALWLVLRFILISVVVAAEGVGAMEVFRRTGKLSAGRIGVGAINLVKVRLTVLVTIVVVILLLTWLLTGLPLLAATVIAGPRGLSPAITIPLELLQLVLGAMGSPLYVVFQTMFYVDMRCRREGFDLETKLDGASA